MVWGLAHGLQVVILALFGTARKAGRDGSSRENTARPEMSPSSRGTLPLAFRSLLHPFREPEITGRTRLELKKDFFK